MAAPNVVITFIARHQAYNAGEQAGFSPGKAQQLVAAGVAVLTPLEAAGGRAMRGRAAPQERLLEQELVAAAADVPVLGHPEREPEPGSGGAAGGKGRTGRERR